MPEIPDEVYRTCAEASWDAPGTRNIWCDEQQETYVELMLKRPDWRALVESAYRAGREDAARDRDDQIRRAVRRLVARIIANAHLLDVPFTDAPDRSPWTELKREMNTLYEVVGIRLQLAPWGERPRTREAP